MVISVHGIMNPARRSALRTALLMILGIGVFLAGAGCKTMPESITSLPGIKQIGQATGATPTEEDRVAAVLDDVERGLESRQIYKVLSHVAGNYHDAEGRTYNSMQAYLQDLFKNYKEIRVTRVTPRVTLQGNRARVIESFGTVAEPFDTAKNAPINVQGQVAVTLEKAGNEWVIVEWGALL